jgi:aminopeptidase N
LHVVGGDKRNFRLTKDVLPSRYELRFELEFDAWTSTGWERITLRTARPSRAITLHSIDLEIADATVDGTNKLADVQTDAESETATLRFANEIAAGEHALEISWKGGIRDSLRGLYRSLRGEERYAAT